MNLNEYLTSNHETTAHFADRVKSSPKAVSKWRRRERIPSPRFMRAIIDATKGKVGFEDFVPKKTEEA